MCSSDLAFARNQANIWATNQLYNGLVQLDDDLNVQPCLAKRWGISDDGLTYTFYLRDDVYFHEDEAFGEATTRLVTASDVAYSLGRIIDPAVGSPGSWIFKGRVAEQDPFVAQDDTTFVLTLAAPFRPMLGILTMQYCSVVPREAVEAYGQDFRSHPVGTGPFRYKRWIESQALFLQRNPAYWERSASGDSLPYLDAVRVNFITDRKTAYLEFRRGKLDYISGIEASYVNELLTPDGELHAQLTDEIQMIKSPYLNTEYLGIYQSLPDEHPLSDVRVRQALNYGLDRDLMLRTLRNTVGRAADAGFVPRGLPTYSAEAVPGYSYQPDRARSLLAAAGYPDGEGMPTLQLRTQADYLDLCNFAARQWQDLGIKVQVISMESATLRNMMKQGQAAFFRASWIADYPDAESFLVPFYGESPAPPNYTQFSSPEFDALYRDVVRTQVDSTRRSMYHAMDRIVVEQAPVVFLFYDETAVFARADLEGLPRNAVNLLNLKQVRFK